jgi:hypothetical protein
VAGAVVAAAVLLSSFAAGSALATIGGFAAGSVLAGAVGLGADSVFAGDSDFAAAFGLLSVTAIELLAVVSAGDAVLDFASALGAGAFATGVVGFDSAGDGVSVGSFFSALDDLSALDDIEELDDAEDSVAGSGEIGVGGCTGVVAFTLAARDTGGGFIQSRTYGTATAPNTPRTIRTRTTRNHVAAKIERGGTSS